MLPALKIGKLFFLIARLSFTVVIAMACSSQRSEVEQATSMPTDASATATLAAASLPTNTALHTATSALPTLAAPTNTALPTVTSSPTALPTPTAPPGPLEGESLVQALRSGGYVLYFRHAATDPVPDDADPVVLPDCDTQRNLSAGGREQARQIGQAIEMLEIPIGRVLASPFCRAIDTARLAFRKVNLEASLENLETAENEAEREARIESLRRLLSAHPEAATNSVLVGHGFNISAAANVTIAEGEAAIFRPEGEAGFTLVGTVLSSEWEELASRLTGLP